MTGGADISADVAALSDLAEEMGRYTGQSVWGEAQVANDRLNDHAPFGVATASGYVTAARARYQENLVQVVKTLHEYAREAAALSISLAQASGNYLRADGAAASRTAGAGGTTVPAGFIGPVATPPPPVEEVVATRPPTHVAESEGGSTGGWCTNWSAYDAPAIFEMVAADNVCAGETQVLAWNRISQSLEGQATDLEKKRNAAAQAWNGQGGAAEAFLTRFDRLIASMKDTAGAAKETATAVDRINSEIQRAQQELGGVSQEYGDKSTDLMPSFLDGAEDELNEKARVRMAEAEREVHSAAQGLPAIPVFESDGNDDWPPPPQDPGDPPRPRDPGQPDSPSDSSDRRLARRDPPPPIRDIQPVLPPGSEWVPSSTVGTVTEGPQLTGVTGVSTVPGGGGLNPVGVPSVTGGLPPTGPGTGGGFNPVVPGPVTGGMVPPVGGGMVPPVGGGGVRGPGGAGGIGATGSGRVPPVGGVIGATPPGAGTSGAAGGRPVTGGVPGVIGGSPAGARPSAGGAGGGAGTGVRGGVGGRAGGVAGVTPMVPPGGGGRRAADGSDPATAGHGENEWEVEQGVAPVIEPGVDRRRHDPGPGVIGIDL